MARRTRKTAGRIYRRADGIPQIRGPRDVLTQEGGFRFRSDPNRIAELVGCDESGPLDCDYSHDGGRPALVKPKKRREHPLQKVVADLLSLSDPAGMAAEFAKTLGTEKTYELFKRLIDVPLRNGLTLRCRRHEKGDTYWNEVTKKS